MRLFVKIEFNHTLTTPDQVLKTMHYGLPPSATLSVLGGDFEKIIRYRIEECGKEITPEAVAATEAYLEALNDLTVLDDEKFDYYMDLLESTVKRKENT
jgi:hypothetical protein